MTDVASLMRRLAVASDRLTGGAPDVAVTYDRTGWYVGVAVKPKGQRDRIARATGHTLDEAVEVAARKVYRQTAAAS